MIWPAEHHSDDAALIAPTAQALRLWRRLGLELGEAAIYTGGPGLGDVVGLVAKWHGAVPVIRLTDSARDAASDVETVEVADTAVAVEKLRALCAGAPGVAAVDVSGRGTVLSVMLEAMPRWGRLLLAGPAPDPFTTAFYADIHRKGVVVCASGDLDSIFTEPAAWDVEVRNAARLLTDPSRAAQLRACLAKRVTASPVVSGTGV
jgi:hypothetical protein